jgi:hypothetical protein
MHMQRKTTIQVESSAATPLKLTRIAGNIKCANNVCLEVRRHAQVMQHSNAYHALQTTHIATPAGTRATVAFNNGTGS